MDEDEIIKRIRIENPTDKQLKLILTQFKRSCHDEYFEKGEQSIRELFHIRKENARCNYQKSLLKFDEYLQGLKINKFSQLLRTMASNRVMAIEFVDLFNITTIVDVDEVYRNDEL